MFKILTSKVFFVFILLSYIQLGFGANYCRLSDKIVKSYIKESAIPRRLLLTAHGGALMHDVKKIILNFKSFDTLTVNEARILYVDMMEEFLSRINSNSKIRPYLHNFPFNTENYELTIGFRDSKFDIRADGHVALMYIGRDNRLLFRGYDARKEEFYALHEEPYEEALKIVKAQREECAKPAA